MPSTLRVQLQLRIVSDDDTVIRDEVILQLDKSDDRFCQLWGKNTRCGAPSMLQTYKLLCFALKADRTSVALIAMCCPV